MRWLGWIIAGLLLGLAAHLAAILLLPGTATRDAFSRLAAFTPANQIALLPQPSPAEAGLPFADPAFAVAVCRYDVSAGPLRVRMPVTSAYGSLTFYTRAGIAYYAINDRAAGRRTVELEVMTAAQRADIDEDEEVTAADRLIVETPSPTGLIVMRALALEPVALPIARGSMAAAECRIQPKRAP